MKKSIVIILLLISPSIFGQELMNFVSNNEVSVIGYWNKGEKVKYSCSRIEKSFKNGKKKPIDETIKEYEISLSVIDSTEHSYTIDMRYSDFTGVENKTEEMCYSMMSQLSIKYVVDEYGAYDSIINKKELHSAVERLIEETYKNIPDTSSLAMLKRIFLEKDNLEALFVSDIIMIHNLYGIGLELAKPIEYDLEFLTLENYELLGKGKITLTSIDKQRNKARITSAQKPNKKETEKYISYLMGILSGGKELSSFKVSNYVNQSYEMELSTGWMLKIKSKSVSRVGYEGKSTKKEVINTYIRN